jgi:hypothetical protein
MFVCLCVYLEYFTAMCYILWPFGKLVVISYIFLSFIIVCHENSCNPGILYIYIYVCIHMYGTMFLV